MIISVLQNVAVVGGGVSLIQSAPSGLVATLDEGANLVSAASFILEQPSSIPNSRVVLDTQHWVSHPVVTRPLRTSLQKLAERRQTTLALKMRAKPYVYEFEPAFMVAAQLERGALFAIDMGLTSKSLSELMTTVRRVMYVNDVPDLREADAEKERQLMAALEIIRRIDVGEEIDSQSFLSLDVSVLVGLMIHRGDERARRVVIRFAAEGNWSAAGYLYHSRDNDVLAFEEARTMPGSRLMDVLQSLHETSAAARATPDLETMLLGSNNFLPHYFMTEGMKWNSPEMQRLRSEHPELVQSIMEIIQRSRGSLSNTKSPLYRERQSLLWEAYRIMATYTDLIDVYDPYALMR